MTMKPPSGLAAESDSEREPVDAEDLSDEVMVDASEDVTVEASEDVTTESVTQTHVGESTPPPLSSLASSALGGPSSSVHVAASVMSVLSPSLPLPGVTAPSARDFDRAIDEDVTTLARGHINEDVTRPAITDDDEEETKVEPAETALHAAATRDDVGTALSEQASLEREKALRKSGFGFEVPAPRRSDDVEFADPGDEDDDGAVISADPVDDDDIDDIDDQEVEPVAASEENEELDDSSDEDSTAMFAKATESSPLAAALTARRPGSPPTGSPFGRDTFGSARLPSPTPGFTGLSMSGPALAQAPAPASSPFGRLAAVPGTSPYGARATTSPLPALQIPAPSGDAAPTTGGTGLFKKIEVPLGGLFALAAVFLVVGLIVGAKFAGGASATPVTLTTARPLPSMPSPSSGPVVQPVPPPTPSEPPTPIPAAAAVAPTPMPAAAAAARKPAPSAAEDNGAEGGEAAGLGEPPAPKPMKRIVKPRKPALTLPDEGPVPKPVAAKPAAVAKPAAAAAKPAAAKPAKGGKKAWVDPFAQ